MDENHTIFIYVINHYVLKFQQLRFDFLMISINKKQSERNIMHTNL